ncbi:hypothetical protein [Maribacter sp. MAR_2009_72]|uniref:hypothetical protein n=1 Tax=Maribacter sp. MAR_2009_72 TaxID=1250050 RepID=UPI0011993CCE|nr:hypothetical protein [Maribacter sp. MAR_2009_72]TVZ16875.1 hypothetical protein JM81_3147 [Maribacter sp. MAR_2009_72]
MNVRFLYPVVVLALLGILFSLANTPNMVTYTLPVSQHDIAQTESSSFTVMMDVLTHQRCMNCHPNDNIPKQGDDRHPHYFGMARGINDKGFQATNCHTCHQSVNNKNSGVPGAPHWALAPASMGWEGLTRTEIAVQLLNRETNGNKSHEELIEHMTKDELVLWAWDPGVNANGMQRTLPPVSKEDFKKAVVDWFANGAVIPTK